MQKPIFIQTVSEGEWNIKRYSLKKMKSTRAESRSHCFFTPDDYERDKIKIDAAIKRGQQFFTSKDGFLFGAKFDLLKLGKFSMVSA